MIPQDSYWINATGKAQLTEYCTDCEHHRANHLAAHCNGACVNCDSMYPKGPCSFTSMREAQAKRTLAEDTRQKASESPLPAKQDYWLLAIAIAILIGIIWIGAFVRYWKAPEVIQVNPRTCFIDSDCDPTSQYCDVGVCRKLGR